MITRISVRASVMLWMSCETVPQSCWEIEGNRWRRRVREWESERDRQTGIKLGLTLNVWLINTEQSWWEGKRTREKEKACVSVCLCVCVCVYICVYVCVKYQPLKMPFLLWAPAEWNTERKKNIWQSDTHSNPFSLHWQSHCLKHSWPLASTDPQRAFRPEGLQQIALLSDTYRRSAASYATAQREREREREIEIERDRSRERERERKREKRERERERETETEREIWREREEECCRTE